MPDWKFPVLDWIKEAGGYVLIGLGFLTLLKLVFDFSFSFGYNIA